MSVYSDYAIAQYSLLEADIAFLKEPFTQNAVVRDVRDGKLSILSDYTLRSSPKTFNFPPKN